MTPGLYSKFYDVGICRVNIEHVQLSITQNIKTFNDDNNCKQYARVVAHAHGVASHAQNCTSDHAFVERMMWSFKGEQ